METFLEFAEKVESNKNKLKDLLLELKKMVSELLVMALRQRQHIT